MFLFSPRAWPTSPRMDFPRVFLSISENDTRLRIYILKHAKISQRNCVQTGIAGKELTAQGKSRRGAGIRGLPRDTIYEAPSCSSKRHPLALHLLENCGRYAHVRPWGDWPWMWMWPDCECTSQPSEARPRWRLRKEWAYS